MPIFHPSTTKKQRKPAVTRARPSSDVVAQTKACVDSRGYSQAPSDITRRASPTRIDGATRSVSRNSESLPPEADRRSRSRSIDAIGRHKTDVGHLGAHLVNRSMVRAPSGKDLFKGREVGLMRRTTSMVVKKEKESQVGEMSRSGLLGRKTSDGDKRKRDSDGEA